MLSRKKIPCILAAACLALILICGGFSFYGQDTAAETAGAAAGEPAGTSYSLDIVQAVQDQARSRSSLYDDISNSSMASRYQMILNGSGGDMYYLQDVTGDEIPELIAGEGIRTVYTYEEGEIRSLGTVAGSELYFSEEYGILAQDLSDQSFQLRAYRLEGELMMASVLVSEKDPDRYEEEAAPYLDTASPLVGFEMTDRSALGA